MLRPNALARRRPEAASISSRSTLRAASRRPAELEARTEDCRVLDRMKKPAQAGPAPLQTRNSPSERLNCLHEQIMSPHLRQVRAYFPISTDWKGKSGLGLRAQGDAGHELPERRPVDARC